MVGAVFVAAELVDHVVDADVEVVVFQVGEGVQRLQLGKILNPEELAIRNLWRFYLEHEVRIGLSEDVDVNIAASVHQIDALELDSLQTCRNRGIWQQYGLVYFRDLAGLD